jgi:transposase
VTPYVKSNKNDRNDAEAICEAISRPSMRFVPPKSTEQLAIQAVHRIRRRLVSDRVKLVNQVRGLLAEHGIVIPRDITPRYPNINRLRLAEMRVDEYLQTDAARQSALESLRDAIRAEPRELPIDSEFWQTMEEYVGTLAP